MYPSPFIEPTNSMVDLKKGRGIDEEIADSKTNIHYRKQQAIEGSLAPQKGAGVLG